MAIYVNKTVIGYYGSDDFISDIYTLVAKINQWYSDNGYSHRVSAGDEIRIDGEFIVEEGEPQRIDIRFSAEDGYHTINLYGDSEFAAWGIRYAGYKKDTIDIYAAGKETVLAAAYVNNNGTPTLATGYINGHALNYTSTGDTLLSNFQLFARQCSISFRTLVAGDHVRLWGFQYGGSTMCNIYVNEEFIGTSHTGTWGLIQPIREGEQNLTITEEETIVSL